MLLLGIHFMIYYHDLQTVALTGGSVGKPPGWGRRVRGREAGGALNPAPPLQLNQLHLNLHGLSAEEKPHN